MVNDALSRDLRLVVDFVRSAVKENNAIFAEAANAGPIRMQWQVSPTAVCCLKNLRDNAT
jgi:hypothetical protein